MSGVGTIHTTGGVASNLQFFNNNLLFTISVAIGSRIGAGWNAIKLIKRVCIKNYIKPKKYKKLIYIGDR